MILQSLVRVSVRKWYWQKSEKSISGCFTEWLKESHTKTILSEQISPLMHKKLEMFRCIISTVATDALVPKHRDISIHSSG